LVDFSRFGMLHQTHLATLVRLSASATKKTESRKLNWLRSFSWLSDKHLIIRISPAEQPRFNHRNLKCICRVK
jgi:hypothetical protein